MTTITAATPSPRVSGRRREFSSSDNEPLETHNGVEYNDGSGYRRSKRTTATYDDSEVDEGGRAVARDETLTEILISKGVREANLISAIVSLGEATMHIAVALHNYVPRASSLAGGIRRLRADCDDIVFRALRDAGVFAVAASDETPKETSVRPVVVPSSVSREGEEEEEDGPWYSIGFDPLNGSSSIVDANFPVGSVFGIWPGEGGLLGVSGREQVASAISLYGPRTTMMIALPSSESGGCVVAKRRRRDSVFEATLVGDRSRWEVSRDAIVLAPRRRAFAPGNLRAACEDSRYDALVRYWVREGYALRHSGGTVADAYHMVATCGGVFSHVSSAGAEARLRLLYVVAAMGLLVECAGGATTHEFEDRSVLDVVVDDLDRSLGVCFGSKDEVQIFKDFMFDG